MVDDILCIHNVYNGFTLSYLREFQINAKKKKWGKRVTVIRLIFNLQQIYFSYYILYVLMPKFT